jgi:hypothetical protein
MDFQVSYRHRNLLEGDTMDNIKNVSSNTTSTSLRGGMKVANDAAPVDTFSPSGKTEKSFLGKIGDTIKGIFSHSDESEAKPQKEPGGWTTGPDGQSVWYTQSNPPPPKNAYGHWSLDTACGAANWYWCKNSEPAEGPSYGPAYKPHDA